jgi:transposase
MNFETKVAIAQWTIQHDKNYQAAAIQFSSTYQQVYRWVQKFEREGANGLIDRRGRKPRRQTETQRLQIQVKLLQTQLQDRLLTDLIVKKAQPSERRDQTKLPI